MRYSLINPPWNFEGSIYFGCREPHLPLEFGYSKALLESAGHEVQIVDGQFDDLSLTQIREQVSGFDPDFIVVTTAPSYLFWRCAPPELRMPKLVFDALSGLRGTRVCVGPHASTTPKATLAKLPIDIAVLGECEEILPKLTEPWAGINSIAYGGDSGVVIQGQPHAADMTSLPPLHWSEGWVARHQHHHHRFDAKPSGPGAEMETSRGCPYHCTFCAKDNFRNSFRRRPVITVAEELDGLIAQGAEYVYFIDEIFLSYKDVLEMIASRNIKFGVQTRIDLWSEPMLDLLGRAGCVSVEAGVESITEAGRALLDKKCKMSTEEITGRLIYAKQRIPFVQANLLDSQGDNPGDVEAWRETLQQHGVWANKPVPLYPYPGSPDYTNRWGSPDNAAWERAHEHYLTNFDEFSDIQEDRPVALVQLETGR